jgi:hypothetical protein
MDIEISYCELTAMKWKMQIVFNRYTEVVAAV